MRIIAIILFIVAQDPVYIYNLTNSQIYDMYKTQVVVVEAGTPTVQYVVRPYGAVTRFHINNQRYGYKCEASYCLLGVFTYTKNNNVYQPGTGLNLSNTGNVYDRDVRQINAIGWSSSALRAGITGYLEDDIIKNLIICMLMIAMGPFLMTKLWEMIAAGKVPQNSISGDAEVNNKKNGSEDGED